MNAEEQLIKDLKAIADEKVPEEDYQQHVDRWNRYQEALYKVQMQCQVLNLRFRRKMVTSYSERRINNVKKIVALTAFTGTLCLLLLTLLYPSLPAWAQSRDFNGGLSLIVSVYTATIGTAALINSGPLPEKIKFSVTASIRYDELFYIQRFIRGMQRERKDPKIVLPSLTMHISHAWLKQQSLLKIMDSMNEVKL